MDTLFDMDGAMVIDEADDMMAANVEQFVVDEEFADTQEQFVVDEDQAIIPGSDAIFVEEGEPEQQAKDWTNDGDHAQFIAYIKEKLAQIPKHSGNTIPGCERAKAYLKSLDSEISKAMRSDLNGVINEVEIDKIRKDISVMIERLDKQLKKLQGPKRAELNVRLISQGHCDVCEAEAPLWHDVENERVVCMGCNKDIADEGIEKIAGTPVLNVYVSAFERSIVGIIINATVSGGKNVEEVFEHLKNKYNFTPRETLSIIQLVADYGFPMLRDRGLIDEPVDPSSGEGVEHQTNYNS